MKRFAILLLCLTSLSTISAQQIAHICPPDWFVGMRDSSLQLMIHGEGMGDYQVSVAYPGVRVAAVTKVENANYLFVDLVIDAQTKPGVVPIQFSAAKKTFTYNYTLHARTKRNFAYGLDASDMIYLLMPDRFANGDLKNDVIAGMNEKVVDRTDPKGRHGGDLAGMTAHLDDIRDMGMTAVWPTPLIENNQPKYSYHGYAATDHYKIDARYGSNAEYAAFVQEAHKRNIKVVVDLVHNHIGNEHWFFKDLPMSDWVHRLDTGFVRSNYRTSVKLDPYASEYDYRKMNEGWFDHHMPDLNQDNPYLSKYIIQNNIWWIETFQVDGFRLDTYPYSDLKFLQEWAIAVLREYPGFGIFGEVWVNGAGVQGYFHGNNKLDDGYDSYLPGLTDFNLYEALYTGLNENFGWYEGMRRIYHNLAQDYMYGDVMRNVIFLSNHDVSRFYSVMGENMQKFKMGIAFAFTTRGMVQWYYGDEIGMKNYVSPEDGKVREDYPGGWPTDGVDKFDRMNLNATERAIYDYTTVLANWRKQSDAIAHGKLMQFIPEDGVYVYFRYTDTETVMVVLNTSTKEYSLDTVRFAERLQGFTGAFEVTDKTTQPLSGLKVSPASPGVFVLK